MTPDQHIRTRALDPEQSFCITAPAGSGKTELLTQRVLRLLTRVSHPQQVLSITFTRKAAAEMRHRITDALDRAARQAPLLGEHEAATRQLADRVLTHADRLGWSVNDPGIFNIRTIDSLCHHLTTQMPLLSGLGGNVAATDDADPLYEAAVDSLFASGFADSSSREALSSLLLNFDNNWERLRTLLINLLRKRGDWAHRILDTDEPVEAEKTLHRAVRLMVEDALHRARDAMGEARLDALQLLVDGAARSLEEQHQAGELGTTALRPGPMPADFSAGIEALSSWHWAANVLLVKNFQKPGFRRKLDKNCGFPTTDKPRKVAALSFIEQLAADPQMLSLWDEVKRLPRLEAGEPGWQLVMHLAHLLPLLEAHLLLVFRSRGRVDHVHIALAAESALGTDDEPTDLALKLDYQLEHILVDEFQDTSDSQFRLLERLTRDWASFNQQTDTPRTIFLVGDGMQSIYRFRSANVGLFIEAREHGLGGLRLEPLSLSSNFRSQAGLVAWVNRRFAQLMPAHDEPARGQIRHTQAEAVLESLPVTPVEGHVFAANGGVAEARWIAAQVQLLRQQWPDASIAVLARGRKQLAPVARQLSDANIPVLGRDLEPLSSSSLVQDLLCICRWLANPADTVAALALLRSPAVGLKLADIEALFAEAAGEFSLIDALTTASDVLSDDGASRALMLHQTLRWAETSRDRLGLAAWIEQTWLRLDGPAVVSEQDWPQAEQFFQLLIDAERAGIGLDIDGLQRLLDKRFVEYVAVEQAVEVLTLHKSKGLQFDFVFIAGLVAKSRSDDRDLLRWHWHQHQARREMVIAADDGSAQEDLSLYQYLSWLDTQRNEAERRRLLYVGITRAKQRVWLTGEVDDPLAWEPAENTLLGLLLADDACPLERHPETTQEVAIPTSRLLLRRTSATLGERANQPVAAADRPQWVPTPGNRLERHAGIALHRALELLADREPLPTACPDDARRAIELQLLSVINDAEVLAQQTRDIVDLVDRVLSDHQGRWLLAAHPSSASELSLLQLDDHGKEFIVDRTFVDDTGCRWIVDYKSSRPRPDQSLETFLAEERERYKPQLLVYLDALQRLDQRQVSAAPVSYKLALYFPVLAHLEVVDAS